MAKIKIVTKATVEVIKHNELAEGDFILWANFRCKVLRIDKPYRGGKVFAVIDGVPEEGATMDIPRYLHFYRILSYETTEVEV